MSLVYSRTSVKLSKIICRLDLFPLPHTFCDGLFRKDSPDDLSGLSLRSRGVASSTDCQWSTLPNSDNPITTCERPLDHFNPSACHYPQPGPGASAPYLRLPVTCQLDLYNNYAVYNKSGLCLWFHSPHFKVSSSSGKRACIKLHDRRDKGDCFEFYRLLLQYIFGFFKWHVLKLFIIIHIKPKFTQK